MQDAKCPFDGVFCQNKQNYVEELQMFAFRCPELVVPYQTNLLNGCPVKSDLERKDICKRYYQYCLDNTHETR